jgi:hypothetical protein
MENKKLDIRIEDIAQLIWREFFQKHGIEPMLDSVESLVGRWFIFLVIPLS